MRGFVSIILKLALVRIKFVLWSYHEIEDEATV